jgi:tetratricopeptide (TPR) repeat protein
VRVVLLEYNHTVSTLGIRGEDTDSTSKGVTDILSLDNLMLLLQSTNSMEEDAIVVEETIKETFKAHSSEEIRYLLNDGIAELLHGHHDRARGIFLEIVKLHDPSYYEAWNKLATCHYMFGDIIPSIEATQEVVWVHQPQHFQALNGLGLAQYECRQYQNAIDSFRKCIQIDQCSPVSSRLTV